MLIMEISPTVKQQIHNFIKTLQSDHKYKPRNLAIENEQIYIYLRNTCISFNNKPLHILNIASIEIAEEFRYKGLFKSLIKYCTEISPIALLISETTNLAIINHLTKLDNWELYQTDPTAETSNFIFTKTINELTLCGRAYAQILKQSKNELLKALSMRLYLVGLN